MVAEVSKVLNERVAAAEEAGIYRWNIIIDPGIGFAKARVLNLQVLRRLSEVKQNCHGLPLLVSCNTRQERRLGTDDLPGSMRACC